MTRLLTTERPFICARAEVALGADLTLPADSWDWTELGDYEAQGRTRPRLINQTIEITNGRRDESRLSDPSQVSLVLGNGDGALTPRNPSSPYWPGLVRGTPCRVSVQAGLPHLVLTGLAGSRARTPDAVALDITTDLAGAIELLAPVQHPALSGTYELVGKFNVAGGQRSWLLYLGGGTLGFRWSTNGTDEFNKRSVLALPSPEAGPITIAWELDVSNAGNNVLTWYVRRGTLAELLANLDESQFGDPVVDSGTTSVFASTATLDIGDVGGSGFSPFPGRVNRFQLRAGNLSTGTIVANADFTAQAAGATGFTDSAGRTWSLNASEITDWRPRFCGRIDSSRANWEVVDEDNVLAPTIAHVEVSASGILERLNQGDNLQSALTRAIVSPSNAANIIACWPFEDESEALQVAQLVTGAAPMQIRGEYQFAADESYAASLQQMTISSGDNAYMTAPIPPIPQVGGVNWQVTRFFRINEPTTSSPGTQLMAVDTNGESATWRIAINDTQISISGTDIDGNVVVLDSFPSDERMFNSEAMIILDVTDDGVNVDWEVLLIPVPLGVGFGTSGTFVGNTGIPTRFRNSCTGPPEGISLGHLIVTSGLAVSWLAPADTAYVNEPAGQRVFRLCRERGLPVVIDGPYGYDWDAAIAAGAQPMGPQRPLKLLDLLDECAEVDQGLLGEQRGALGLTFRSGAAIRNQSVRLTLTRAERQLIEPFDPTDDDLRFVNDITVSRPDGSSFRIEDPDITVGDEERYQQTVEVNVANDLHLPDQAGWRYHLGKWPELRYPQLSTDIAKSAELVEPMLGFGIGDRFQIPDPPPGHPPNAIDQLADGLTEQIERFQWRFDINGHPARPWDTAVLDDDELGRLDTAGSELAAEFEAGTDTTMSVSTTLGPLWTTDSGELPFEVEIAGARVTVTAISGASSPQTFTVSTTIVNGVEKVIAAGEAVQLWSPAVIAL